MAGIIVIASMFPLCHLTVTLRFSQPNPLGFVTKIYPFLGLNSHLESSSEIDYPDDYIPCALGILPGNSLIGFAPLKHVGVEELLKDASRLTHHERLQGLATLLAFFILQPLRPYFMPAALMGFPLQSLLPELKPKPFQVLCFPAVHFPAWCPTLSRRTRDRELTLRSFAPQFKQYF